MSENTLVAVMLGMICSYWIITKAIDAWERVNTTYCCDCEEEEGEVKDENITL